MYSPSVPTPTYEVVADADLATELGGESARPVDVGSDMLPFDHLSGRRFEILAFLLKQSMRAAEERVTLLKSSRDRGRDVALYRSGRLVELIQCKNQMDAMTRPDVMRELMKIALHGCLDSALLPDGESVTVAMWCTAGFSEQAANLIDTWPTGWLETELLPRFEETRQRYRAFGSLTWDSVRDAVLRFAQRVNLDKHDATSLTPLIRSIPSILGQFFTTVTVVRLEDAQVLVEEALEKKDWRRLPQDDVRAIVDRIVAQPDDRRFYFGSAHVLGMSAKVIADMPVQHRETFLRGVMAPLFDTATILLKMIGTRSGVVLQANIGRCEYRNKAFPLVFQQCLTGRAASRLLRLFTPGPLFETLASRSTIETSDDLWLVLDNLCSRVGSSFSRILEPGFKPPTSNAQTEATRRALAQDVLAGYADKEAFVAVVKEDCRRNLQVIRECITDIEGYFPADLLVIVDARSVFDSPQLHEHLIRSLKTIEGAEVSGDTVRG